MKTILKKINMFYKGRKFINAGNKIKLNYNKLNFIKDKKLFIHFIKKPAYSIRDFILVIFAKTCSDDSEFITSSELDLLPNRFAISAKSFN